MSLLPESLEEATIKNMLPGDRGYTLPWAVWADKNRVMWINGNYNIEPKPHGTRSLLIERTETGVKIAYSDLKNERFSLGEPCFVGGHVALPVELCLEK